MLVYTFCARNPASQKNPTKEKTMGNPNHVDAVTLAPRHAIILHILSASNARMTGAEIHASFEALTVTNRPTADTKSTLEGLVVSEMVENLGHDRDHFHNIFSIRKGGLDALEHTKQHRPSLFDEMTEHPCVPA